MQLDFIFTAIVRILCFSCNGPEKSKPTATFSEKSRSNRCSNSFQCPIWCTQNNHTTAEYIELNDFGYIMLLFLQHLCHVSLWPSAFQVQSFIEIRKHKIRLKHQIIMTFYWVHTCVCFVKNGIRNEFRNVDNVARASIIKVWRWDVNNVQVLYWADNTVICQWFVYILINIWHLMREKWKTSKTDMYFFIIINKLSPLTTHGACEDNILQEMKSIETDLS